MDTPSNLSLALAFTLIQEGSFQRMRADGGNWTGGRVGRGALIGTNRGISAPLLAKYLGRIPSTADMQNLSLDTTTAIYAQEFAGPLLLEALLADRALMLFDMSVQHGTPDTVRIAQAVAGCTVDGRVGPNTLKAVNGLANFLPAMDAAFLAMLQGLGEEWALYGEDWGRRATERLAAAQALAVPIQPSKGPA